MSTSHPVELVTTPNPDGVPLDGALWRPHPAPVAAVVHLHAKGGNFYTGPGRFIPERTAHLPLWHLSINMRAHDLGTTRADLPSGDLFRDDAEHGRGATVDGGMWERIADGPGDVAAAVALVRSLTDVPVFLAGHSSGGFYVATAAPGLPVAGRILLSPLTGNRTALPAWYGSPAELDAAVARARDLVAAGRGDQLLTVPHWYYAISARSLVERADEPDGTWLDAMRAVDLPTLALWAATESRATLWAELLEASGATVRRAVEVPGSDHHYLGAAQEVADAVAGFVLDVAGGAPGGSGETTRSR